MDAPYQNATAEKRTTMPHSDMNLWNTRHLLVHPVDVPLSFEVPVQAQQPKLLQGTKGFDASRDLVKLR